MPTLRFTTRIEGSAHDIFATIVDFSKYHLWLSRSKSFGTISEISPDPVSLGTTYVDAGPSGTRRGTVTEFEPPATIAFQQPMNLKKSVLPGRIDIHIRYSLEPAGGGTDVIRDLTFEVHGPLRIARPLIVSAFRHENERVLSALKTKIETPAPNANPP
jgi:Polyketide cyclase / dehydrase and lipid transport